MAHFSKYAITIPSSGKRVVKIEIALAVYNATGDVYFTDIMYQGGTLATEWYGSPAEVAWSFNG